MLVSERKPILARQICRSIFFLFGLLLAFPALASVNIPLSVTLSEVVTVTGFPQIAVDVGGTTRYAVYSSGSGTNTLTFTLSPPAGDVDLDGVTVSSPILLNGGTIKDTAGNDLASLTFTPPNTSGIKINYPSLSMDFVDDADGRYTLNGTTYNDLASFLAATGGSFTRASIGTYYDSSGTLQTASAGTPRFDWDPVTHAAKGILIEEARTNYVTNSTMQGATIGVLPTNWNWDQITAGVTLTITGVGTENGLPYLQIHISGTPTSTQLPLLRMANVATVAGQTFAYSFYVRRVSGDNIQVSSQFAARQSPFESGVIGGFPSTTSYMRISNTYTFLNAATVNSYLWLRFGLSNGVPVDATFRIAAPQVELGNYASSFIPTSTAAVMRAADVLALPYSVAAPLSFYAELEKVGAGNNDRVFTLDDGSTNNLIQIILGGTLTPLAQITTAGSNQASVTGSSVVLNQAVKLSLRAMANNTRITQNGISYALDNSVTMPVGLTTLRLGHRPVSAEFLMGYIKSLRVYNSALSDTQLQLLTQ